jgi:hypothetical protein
MARIRSIKPEFWDDRKLARRVCRDGRLLYIALWNLADEQARLNGDPQWIKGKVFPYDDDIDAGTVAKLLDELAAPVLGAVVLYEADGDPYILLPKLARHQRLEPAKVPSRIPSPSGSRADESAPRADEVAPGADESALLYVAGSREQGAGSRDVREAHTLLATALLEAHIAASSPRPPRDVLRKTAERIELLLDDPDVTADEITEALRRLRIKGAGAGPGLLGNLIGDIRSEQAGTANGRASPGSRREQEDEARRNRALQRAQNREGTTP